MIDSLFKWSRSIDCQAHIFFIKTKSCSNDDLFISLVVMIGLEKCCITSAYLQWLCHSGERAMARGPLVSLPELKAQDELLTIPCPLSVCPFIPLNGFSEIPGPNFFKLHMEPSVKGGLKICTNGHSS